jgi:Family of unknown function (DUF5947)
VTDALARVIRRTRRRGPAGERCDFCAVELPVQHRHLLDTDRREISCVCQACSLLFHREAASDGHYRLVPRRRVRLSEVPTEGLGVPVGLAFFVPRSGDTVEAHYPSPAGPTRWEVDPAAWRDVVAHCPQLADLTPEVEALLVNTTQGRSEHWLTPIDDCFALVALVRREWSGLSGGPRVWPEIDRFFANLSEQRR